MEDKIKKIAIVGSCLTRDNFNTIFNPDYKNFVECVLHQHQCSLLSLMSPALPYKESEEIEQMNAFSKWHYKTEHTKEFFNLMGSRKPEYLLIDFYADIYLGVVEIEQAFFTYNAKFKELPPLKNAKTVRRITEDFDSYFKIWKEYAESFFQFLQREVPLCKIILVKARFEDNFEGGSSLNEWRKKRNYQAVDIERLNEIWSNLNGYVEDNFQVEVLDMTKKTYLLDNEHPWGNFYVHYTKAFYHDFLEQLIALTQKND
ncbi:DUF6270 domain-containing protein [Listeria fleischmannii]|uniref:Uncharacterized protein n=1 Tax=Listeria fleischmannii TaxID=1069827 RepID=A0A841YC85_9LIST|nr:DUF6270 domain-containing protein [Listeria fleischmannii]MBC1397870.1 hypothetical protein [Listeria fleischmannii]MBC1427365.1 hypothetical protein [Listeria fleischmannii]